MHYQPTKVLVALVFLIACSHSTSLVEAQKISQFDQAGLSDLLIDKAGVYHAVFQESTAHGKPLWIYYSTSTNKGATWSKPVNLSNDNTGNGAGYPRILQDGAGRIYAIWKRYGSIKYPTPSVTLDGPGGTEVGTVYYKVLNGGAWSQQIQLNEDESGQDSWFATVSPQGKVVVFWSQFTHETIKNGYNVSPWYADYIRVVALDGPNKSAILDLSKPSPPGPYNGYPEAKGGWNLEGLVDKTGNPHFLYEMFEKATTSGLYVVKYFDGKSQRTVYTYPANGHPNTFHNPPMLLVDERGTDHMIFMPSNTNLEDQQIWDVNLATNQTNVLLHLPESAGTLESFQATQGPNGQMAVIFEMSIGIQNTEAYGMFYKNGTWQKAGLTKNAAKNTYMSKDFIGVGGWPTNITTETTYNSTFGSVAYDGSGRKSMLMTLTAHWLGMGGYSTNSPSVMFLPIDK